MTFRLVISKATCSKMWSCDLKVWFEKWRWGRIFVEVWNQLQILFSRALARPSALGWKPRKVVIQSTHKVLWRSLPWFTLLWYSKSKLSGHLFGAQFWGSWFGGGIIAYREARPTLVSTHWNEASVWIPSKFAKWLLAVLVFWQTTMHWPAMDDIMDFLVHSASNLSGRIGCEAEFLWKCGTSCKLHFRVPLQGRQRCNPHIVEVLALITLLWYSKSKLWGYLFGAQFWGSWFGGGIIAYR